jgi:Flp pilus assembly pilin Flp
MNKIQKWNRKGQHIVEYAIIASIVGAAMVAMSTYVFRAVQATQQDIDEEYRNE